MGDDDAMVTGSVTPRPIPVAAPLPEGAAPKGFATADWLQAKQALNQALTSHDTDVSISWENQASGAHGTATPIGPKKAGGCRDFMISVVKDAGAGSWVQGTACRDNGQVVLSQVRMLGGA